MRRFVEKCLATVSDRLSARELLDDPFLQDDDFAFDMKMRALDYEKDYNMGPMLIQPHLKFNHNNGSLVNGYSNYLGFERDDNLDYHRNEIDLFMSQDNDGNLENLDISIQGQMKEDNGIFLRLRISDKEGMDSFFRLVPNRLWLLDFISSNNMSEENQSVLNGSLQVVFVIFIFLSTSKVIQH